MVTQPMVVQERWQPHRHLLHLVRNGTPVPPVMELESVNPVVERVVRWPKMVNAMRVIEPEMGSVPDAGEKVDGISNLKR